MVLVQFILVEGQGVEEVRACAERLRTECGFEADEVEEINRLEQVALMVAERYLPLAERRGQEGVEEAFLDLGEELCALARCGPDESIATLYALHNAAACFAKNNGNRPFQHLRFNTEVLATLRARKLAMFDDAPEAILMRKVMAGLYEGEDTLDGDRHATLVAAMIQCLDPDTLGRVEVLLRHMVTVGRDAPTIAMVILDAERLLGMPGRFKPAQARRLREYLDSLSSFPD